jgi:hypothetical protein
MPRRQHGFSTQPCGSNRLLSVEELAAYLSSRGAARREPGAGPTHARLRPPSQARGHLPCRRSRHPPADRRAPETGGSEGPAIQGEAGWEAEARSAACGAVLLLARFPARARAGAGRAGLPPGTGAIKRRLRRACHVRVSALGTCRRSGMGRCSWPPLAAERPGGTRVPTAELPLSGPGRRARKLNGPADILSVPGSRDAHEAQNDVFKLS